MQVIFSKIELEISPFLTVIQFYSNIVENVLARAHQKFQRGQHSEIYLLTFKKQDKTKMELPLESISSASICRTTRLSPVLFHGNKDGHERIRIATEKRPGTFVRATCR